MAKLVDGQTRERTADDYSNYDQSVEIVGCWNSWFSAIEPGCFNPYPSLEIDGVKRTPDFLATLSTGYQLVGELCRLTLRDDGLADSVNQAVGYTALSESTDVMMLVPHEYADQAEKRMLDLGLLHEGTGEEPVVVVSFVRTDANRVTHWVFKRASQRRMTSFRDGHLGAQSLHQKMTVTLEGLKVPPKYWRSMKIRFPFCNDAPPALYTACLLWVQVLDSMLSDDDYAKGRVKRLPFIPLRVTPQTVKAAVKSQLDIEVRMDWVRSALDLLVQARLAQRLPHGSEEYEIKFGRIQVPGSDSSEVHALILDRLYGREEAPAAAQPGLQEEMFPTIAGGVDEV